MSLKRSAPPCAGAVVRGGLAPEGGWGRAAGTGLGPVGTAAVDEARPLGASPASTVAKGDAVSLGAGVGSDARTITGAVEATGETLGAVTPARSSGLARVRTKIAVPA